MSISQTNLEKKKLILGNLVSAFISSGALNLVGRKDVQAQLGWRTCLPQKAILKGSNVSTFTQPRLDFESAAEGSWSVGRSSLLREKWSLYRFCLEKNCFWVQTRLPSDAFARKCFEKYKETLLNFPCGTTYERERDLEHHGLIAGSSC